MDTTRRKVLVAGVAGAASAPLMGMPTSPAIATARAQQQRNRDQPDEGLEPLEPTPSNKQLRLLFLGGTGFLGPHTVNHALARGHHVTLFNRGRTNTHLFVDEVEHLEGDSAPQIRWKVSPHSHRASGTV